MYVSRPSKEKDQNVLILCFHGAGGSALSFCQLGKQLRNYGYTVLAYDLYGHGKTKKK